MIRSPFGTSKRFFDVLTKIRNLFMNLFEEWVIISEKLKDQLLSSFYLQYIEENSVEEAKEMEK